MKAFREDTRDGTRVYAGGLSTPERLVLAQVTGDVVELLGGDDGFIDLEATLDMVGPDGASAHQVLRARLSAEESGDSEADVDSHLRELFEGVDDDISAPSDPAVRRLLPDASDDEVIALEFRRLTDDDLRRRKVDRLLRFADLLLDAAPSRDEDEQLPFTVKAIDGDAIAGALGDIRQVIGTRLELTDDADTEALYDAVASTWDEQDGAPESLDGESAAKIPAHAAPPRRARETMSGSDLFLGSVFVLAGFLQESLTDCMLRHYRESKRNR
jgi:Domain of unknown function (DUF2017)